MNIYETIDFLKTKLEENQNDPADLMYGYNILIDPYADLSKSVPLILIEAQPSTFYNSSEYGNPTMLDHNITLTVFESAQKIEFTDYKSNVNASVKKLIDKLMTISDWRINKLIPVDLTPDEMMLGSLKVTGVVVGIKIRTYWGN